MSSVYDNISKTISGLEMSSKDQYEWEMFLTWLSMNKKENFKELVAKELIDPTSSYINWLWSLISVSPYTEVGTLKENFNSNILTGGWNCDTTPGKGKNLLHYCSFENSTWWKMGIILGINVFFFLVIIGTGLSVYLAKLVIDTAVGYDGIKE